jgi:hypothetical protein
MPVAVDDAHHVARYCSFQKLIQRDPLEVNPLAFELREAETFLSVNHCEHHPEPLLTQLRGILHDLDAKGFITKPAGGLAVLNVKKIKESGERRDANLRVRRRHDEKDASYASIDGLPSKDNTDAELLDLLALEATLSVHRVSDIP